MRALRVAVVGLGCIATLSLLLTVLVLAFDVQSNLSTATAALLDIRPFDTRERCNGEDSPCDPLSNLCFVEDEKKVCECKTGYAREYGIRTHPTSCGRVPGDEDLYTASQQRLREPLAQVCSKGEVVLSFAESTYEDVVLNLVISLEQVGMSNYLIVCLDEKIHDSMQRLHINSVYVGDLMTVKKKGSEIGVDLNATDKEFEKAKKKGFGYAALRNVFVFRMAVVRAALGLGYSVMSVDADVVFLTSIYPYLSPEVYDYEALSATFPNDVRKVWGGTANGGFFHMVANPRTADYLSHAVSNCERIKDDQICYNRLLLNMGVEMEVVDDCMVKGGECRISRGTDDIYVRLLDTKLFATAPRVLNRQSLAPREGLAAVHACALPKKGASKKAFFEQQKLWQLSSTYDECKDTATNKEEALQCITVGVT